MKMNNHNYHVVFEKLAELRNEGEPTADQEAKAQELDEIEELRRFAADLQDPDLVSFTTTT